MEEDNTQNKNKQQTKAGKKKNIEKGEDKLFLLGNINANINVFSQLSNMYQGQLNVNDTSASQGTGVKSEKSTDSDLAFEQFLFSQKQFDFDVTKILNKINKKSETTKLKALTELKTLLSERNVEFYKEFFATWLYIYKQFVTSEFDKKIIEECNNILQIMAPKLKKDLAPYIKQLFPVWYMCMNDPSAEISTSATKAFEDTFPPQKYIAVLTACEDNLLEHIRKTLRLTPVKVLEENHVLTEVQAEEVYDRNILSCLNSVSAAFKLVSETEHRERYVNKIVEMFCLNKPLKGSDLFGLLHNKKRPRVRAGTIELIDSFFKYVPEDIIKLNLGLISTTLFEMLDDKDRSVQRSIWKSCLLVVLKKAASDPEIASKIDVKKYEVKILNLLKSGGYGLGSQMYINLVQFFSYLESFSAKKDENIKAKINDRIGFYKKFFEHILQAYNHEEVRFFGNDLTNSYFECALFCILKRVIPFLEEAKATLSNENELKNMVGILRGFIRDILIPPCQLFISNYSATSALSPYKNIPVCLGNTLGHAEFKQDLQDLGVYSEFEDKFLDLFKQSLAKFHEFDNYCTLLREAIQVKPGSAFYSYFQNLVSQLNSYFQDTLKEGLGKESVVLSDSVLEKQFEELKKVEHFISIFILENSPLKKDRFINLIVNNVKLAFDLTKKFLASSDKIVKVSNIEKFAKFNLGIINDLIQVNQRNVEKLGKIQELDDVFNSLIEIFSANLNNPNDAISFNLHNLILINYLVNPSSLDNFFSDFISYNNNKIAEDTLLNRALESYVKKFKNVNSYSSYKIKHPQQQKLIRDLAIKILKSDKYRMFSSTILNALLFTSDEETVKQVLATFSSHLNLLHDNKGKLTIEFDKLEYIFSSLANLLKAKEFEANAGPEITNCYQTLIKILINLYYGGGASKKKIIIIYDLLKKVPNEDKIPKESLVKGVKDQILVSLQQKVFEQLELNLVNLDNKQKLKIENLCKLVEDYLKFAQTSKKSNFTGNFYQELLQEKYFINSMIYPGIWQVLMTALKAIQQGSDYKSVFHIKGNQKLVDKFYWLILDMISVANSNCLFLSAQEKKFFANISNNYFMNETLTELETKEEDRNNAALEFLKYAMNKCLSKSIIYSNGVKKLLKSLFAESQDLKVVQSILEIVIIQNLKEIQKELSNENNDLNNTFKRAIVHKNIMPVFEKYIPDTQEAWTEIAKGFQNNVQDIVNQNQSDSNSVQKFIISLDVIGSIIAFNSKAMFEDEPLTQIIKFLFTQIKVQDLKEEKFDPNYTLNTIFEFINLVIENKTFTPLSDNIIEIENFFLFGLEYNKVPRKFSSSALIKMNMFLRKVLTYIEVFTEEFRDQVLRGILSICKIKSHEITTTIDLGGQDVTSINNELNDLMITEFAETIARMRMSIGASFDESLLYDLLDLDLTTIQKSAFVLIKHLYQNFPLKTDLKIEEAKLEDKSYVDELFANRKFMPVNPFEVILHQHKREEEFFKAEDEIIEEGEEDLGDKYLLYPRNYGFLLTWISILLKLKYQLGNSASELEQMYKRSFEIYFGSNSAVYFDLMEIIFAWFRGLNLSLVDLKNIISTKNNDVNNISPEWEDFSSNETLFKLILQIVYLFVSKFPKFFRKWHSETGKQNKKDSEMLIRNFISNTLFNDEKTLIENKQGEWKSEEFNIFVTKSTRQIFASYMKEGAKLEIVITVPEDYPLSLVEIQSQNQIKVSKGRLERSLVMMRALLTNENNTFLSALLLWKNNLEKEFEGVEECAICYYIIHASTKDLPKLACKTCKHKFHSACIHKWFESSNKSECPLCKSQFW